MVLDVVDTALLAPVDSLDIITDSLEDGEIRQVLLLIGKDRKILLLGPVGHLVVAELEVGAGVVVGSDGGVLDSEVAEAALELGGGAV